MFFGNMQSYYRRNSILNQSSSHGSQSRVPKEQFKRVKHLSKTEEGDNEAILNATPVRRKSFSISRNPENEEPVNYFKSPNVPAIKIGLYEPEFREKSMNLLIGKEKLSSWPKSCGDQDDNSERLGPNKNNIIEETLRLERRKSDEWKKQL